MIEFNWNPTTRQLRQFGLVALIALPLLGWLLAVRFFAGRETTVVVAAGAVGILCCAVAQLRPAWIKPLFIGLNLIAWPFGMVIGEVVLVVTFFVVFAPIGLVMRVFGRDALQRRLDRSAKSYWQAKPASRGPESYFHQF